MSEAWTATTTRAVRDLRPAFAMLLFSAGAFALLAFTGFDPVASEPYVVGFDDPTGRFSPALERRLGDGKSYRMWDRSGTIVPSAPVEGSDGRLVVPESGGPIAWVASRRPGLFQLAALGDEVRALAEETMLLRAGVPEAFSSWRGPFAVHVDLLSPRAQPAASQATAAAKSDTPKSDELAVVLGVLLPGALAVLVGQVLLGVRDIFGRVRPPRELEPLATHALTEIRGYAWTARAAVLAIAAPAIAMVWLTDPFPGLVPGSTFPYVIALIVWACGSFVGAGRLAIRLHHACPGPGWGMGVAKPVLPAMMLLACVWLIGALAETSSWPVLLTSVPVVGFGPALVSVMLDPTWSSLAISVVHLAALDLLVSWLARDEHRARDLWSRLDRAIDRLLPSRFAVGVPDES